ncbi:MAG: 50S ribosomal protein L6 [Phycisphaerales bacterium]
MSRIGRKPITVPAGVKIAIKGNVVNVSGPGGAIDVPFKPSLKVTWTESEKSVSVAPAKPADEENDTVLALWGTTRALIFSAIIGVTKGYLKEMEVVGVGWTAAVTGTKLKLVVGYANPIMLDIPKDVKVVVDKQIIRISGPNKQSVGQLAAQCRASRKPEPYQGKGVKYTTETIKRKAGKQFGASA